MWKVLKRTQSHQLLAPESTWGLEINVADDSELDLDAVEEMIESLGEEVGEANGGTRRGVERAMGRIQTTRRSLAKPP